MRRCRPRASNVATDRIAHPHHRSRRRTPQRLLRKTGKGMWREIRRKGRRKGNRAAGRSLRRKNGATMRASLRLPGMPRDTNIQRRMGRDRIDNRLPRSVGVGSAGGATGRRTISPAGSTDGWGPTRPLPTTHRCKMAKPRDATGPDVPRRKVTAPPAGVRSDIAGRKRESPRKNRRPDRPMRKYAISTAST